MAGDSYIETIPLSKTTKFIVDNRGRTAPTADHGIPLIATNCISNDQLYPSYEKLRFVSKETYANWFRSHPVPGDIILTNKGSQNGALCLVPNPVDFVIAQDMVALRANEKVIDPLFLFAALRSANVQREIKNLDVSGVIPHFKKTDFDKLHLPYPARNIQEAIGRIYFEFCAKIELNRRMNATLESMARALFQSWFVDFDPVRAKLDGRKPDGMDEETAALFPDSFQDSELGQIPHGWEVRTADEISVVGIGKTPPRKEHQWFSENPADIPWMSIRDLGEAGVFISKTSEFLRPEAVETFRVRRIPDGTVVLSFKLTMGRVAITDGEMLSNEAIAHFRLKPETPFGSAYLFCYLKGFSYDQLGNTSSIATAINSDMVRGIKVVLPSKGVAAAFEGAVAPMFTQMKNNQNQSCTLATIRDTLLPKLLSGELSVAEREN